MIFIGQPTTSQRPALTCHPHPPALDASIQSSAAAVLLQEGVEGS
jgi:hypothetical protein